jgi:hypothetical protein
MRTEDGNGLTVGGIGWRERVNDMSLSMAPILMYDEQVPGEVRDAIRSAYEGPPQLRSAKLESAARILYRETDLGCGDVRELVGLPDEGDCA